jgi:hypothetical protein
VTAALGLPVPLAGVSVEFRSPSDVLSSSDPGGRRHRLIARPLSASDRRPTSPSASLSGDGLKEGLTVGMSRWRLRERRQAFFGLSCQCPRLFFSTGQGFVWNRLAAGRYLPTERWQHGPQDLHWVRSACGAGF